LLEIIAGELNTGVTRFIAVSVKTFVLCLGAAFGMLIALPIGDNTWLKQEENCNSIDLEAVWWRIPLYLLSSASALGQYRMPIVVYWRGLAVQLAAYEVQYHVYLYLTNRSRNQDNTDTAAANVLGSAAAVITACTLASFVNQYNATYFARLLKVGDEANSCLGNVVYRIIRFTIHLGSILGLERATEKQHFRLEKKLKHQAAELSDPSNPRTEIVLTPEEEHVFVESIVSSQSLNIWSILMPALYQLVPGSMIAKLWFSSIFPPPMIEEIHTLPGSDATYSVWSLDQQKDGIFSNLMVISTSLALGLILGFTIVQTFGLLWTLVFGTEVSDLTEAEQIQQIQRERERYGGVYQVPDNDPSSIHALDLAAIPETKEDGDDSKDIDGDSDFDDSWLMQESPVITSEESPPKTNRDLPADA
jgi:hypothetical protein